MNHKQFNVYQKEIHPTRGCFNMIKFIQALMGLITLLLMGYIFMFRVLVLLNLLLFCLSVLFLISGISDFMEKKRFSGSMYFFVSLICILYFLHR